MCTFPYYGSLRIPFRVYFELLCKLSDYSPEPDMVVRRQEALLASRLRMQEELNAQAERYKEKQRQVTGEHFFL